MFFQGIFQYFSRIGKAMLGSSDIKLGVLGVSIIVLNVVQLLRHSKGVCLTPNRSKFFDLAV